MEENTSGYKPTSTRRHEQGLPLASEAALSCRQSWPGCIPFLLLPQSGPWYWVLCWVQLGSGTRQQERGEMGFPSPQPFPRPHAMAPGCTPALRALMCREPVPVVQVASIKSLLRLGLFSVGSFEWRFVCVNIWTFLRHDY